MTDNSELKRQAAAHAQKNIVDPIESKRVMLIDPETVLAMIAENDRLAGCIVQRRAHAEQYDQGLIRMAAERDQLKAENEHLTESRNEAREDRNKIGDRYDQLKAENERLRKIISDSATSCGAAVSVECSLDFMGHLPVEIFSVISKLRNALAECADSLHGEMLQKFGGQLPDDMHPVTRREYDRDMAEVAGYRAAMGKGEQS